VHDRIAALKLVPSAPTQWDAASWIYVTLGDVHFRARDFDKAAEELTRAYMGGGIDIFMEDDPNYLAFLETRIALRPCPSIT
jgi:hypothetical protein